jgi:DNA-binding MarR family transcriptional regulator
MFDEVLAPSGLRSTQLSVLITLARDEPASMPRLAKDLVMDRSTLSRTVRTLEQRGLIEKASIGNGNRKMVSLTDRGRNVVSETLPLWEKAQEQLTSLLGEGKWDTLLDKLSHVVSTATK